MIEPSDNTSESPEEKVEPVAETAPTEQSQEELEVVEEMPTLSREEELELDLAKWKDQAVRSAAELENYRKRVARDLGEARKYGNKDLLSDLLPVLDNFKMGLDAASSDETSMIYLGMKMVKDQLDEFLTNNGVTMHDPTGEQFDHNLHEAISQEETTEYAEGVIIQTVRPGYTLNDHLLRAANVIVATAPSKSTEEDAS